MANRGTPNALVQLPIRPRPMQTEERQSLLLANQPSHSELPRTIVPRTLPPPILQHHPVPPPLGFGYHMPTPHRFSNSTPFRPSFLSREVGLGTEAASEASRSYAPLTRVTLNTGTRANGAGANSRQTQLQSIQQRPRRDTTVPDSPLPLRMRQRMQSIWRSPSPLPPQLREFQAPSLGLDGIDESRPPTSYPYGGVINARPHLNGNIEHPGRSWSGRAENRHNPDRPSRPPTPYPRQRSAETRPRLNGDTRHPPPHWLARIPNRLQFDGASEHRGPRRRWTREARNRHALDRARRRHSPYQHWATTGARRSSSSATRYFSPQRYSDEFLRLLHLYLRRNARTERRLGIDGTSEHLRRSSSEAIDHSPPPPPWQQQLPAWPQQLPAWHQQLNNWTWPTYERRSSAHDSVHSVYIPRMDGFVDSNSVQPAPAAPTVTAAATPFTVGDLGIEVDEDGFPIEVPDDTTENGDEYSDTEQGRSEPGK
jgi:hypothetical protein